MKDLNTCTGSELCDPVRASWHLPGPELKHVHNLDLISEDIKFLVKVLDSESPLNLPHIPRMMSVHDPSNPERWSDLPQGLRSMQRVGSKLAVRKYDFDWHGMLKELRESSTVEALWTKLQSLLPESGLASGVMELRESAPEGSPTGRLIKPPPSVEDHDVVVL